MAAAVFALRLRVSIIGKHTLFCGPLGRFLGWMEGVPVDRGRPSDIVHASAAALQSAPAMWLGLASEGTRSAAAAFKSGFCLIAQGAGVPISIDTVVSYLYRSTGNAWTPPAGAGDRPTRVHGACARCTTAIRGSRCACAC